MVQQSMVMAISIINAPGWALPFHCAVSDIEKSELHKRKRKRGFIVPLHVSGRQILFTRMKSLPIFKKYFIPAYVKCKDISSIQIINRVV